MTRLACFHTSLDPRTRESLERYAPQVGLDVEWVRTQGDDGVYAAELEKRWTGEDDLILIEHDKEIFPDTLPSLLACPELWCGYTYWIAPEPHTALVVGGFGVTRFSAEVQRLVPVSAFAGDSWLGIDRRFYDFLRTRHGEGCHLHGHVLHHHVYEPRPAAVRMHVAVLRERGLVPPAVHPPARDPGLLPGSYRLT